MEFTPIRDFIRYLSNPTRRPFHSEVSKPLLYVSLLFAVSFLINLFAIGLVNRFVVNLENIGNVFDSLDLDFSKMFLLAVILAPLAEELIFRFPLKYKIPLSILISLILSVGLGYYLSLQEWGDSKYIFPFVIFIVINYWLTRDANDIPKVFGEIDNYQDKEEQIDKLFPVFFYLVALVFALIHIGNYDSSQFSSWMIPFIVIPQFVLALFLGFVRMRIGIWASIYMHALNNMIPLILFYSLKDLVVPG